MTDTHPFFRFIWRINGILILFACFLAISVLLYVSREMVSDIFGIRNVSDIVNIEEDNGQIVQHWSLTSTDEVYGTPYFILSLQLEQSYEQSYYEKYSVSIRNYLFINTQQNSKHHWLFDTNDYLIPHKSLLLDPTRDENQKTVAILYEVIKHDSNEDARLSDSDLYTLGLSKPDGSHYKDVMDNVSALLSHKMLDSNTLMLLCRAENHIGDDVEVDVFSLHIDVNNFTILNKVKLPVLL